MRKVEQVFNLFITEAPDTQTSIHRSYHAKPQTEQVENLFHLLSAMHFVPFNPIENVQRTRRALPHWVQEGRTYFVTFRLADSMPRDKREHLEGQRDAWMHSKGLRSLDEIENLSEDYRKEYHRIFTAKIHELLDAGYGSCALREPQNAQIIASALMFFDGQRCEMIS